MRWPFFLRHCEDLIPFKDQICGNLPIRSDDVSDTYQFTFSKSGDCHDLEYQVSQGRFILSLFD